LGCLKLNTEYYSELETKAFLKDLTLKKTTKTLRRSLPYGELFFERRDYWNTPYKFNAKELDAELRSNRRIPLKINNQMRQTGMYYYGARYYTPEVSIWLSVDPMSDKHPDYTPYAYCYNNPINLIDPWGLDTITDPNGNKQNVGTGYQATSNGKFLYGDGLQPKVWDPIVVTGNEQDGAYVDLDTDKFMGMFGMKQAPILSLH